MKYSILFLLNFLLTMVIGQTTVEFEIPHGANYLNDDEYNYCSKGYLADVKLGRDPQKKGLLFEDYKEFKQKVGYSDFSAKVVKVTGVECKCTKAFIVKVDYYDSYVVTMDATDARKLSFSSGSHESVVLSAMHMIIRDAYKAK